MQVVFYDFNNTDRTLKVKMWGLLKEKKNTNKV